MFGSGDFWDKSPLSFLEILKLPSFYWGNFRIFKTALGQFITNCPPKHVITSTDTLKSTKFKNQVHFKTAKLSAQLMKFLIIFLINNFATFILHSVSSEKLHNRCLAGS